jgi:hypothetical protein
MAQKKKINTHLYLHRLAAAVCLVSFTVMLIAGLMAEVPVITIAYRACLVMIVIKIICRVVVSILITYEEMNSGKT